MKRSFFVIILEFSAKKKTKRKLSEYSEKTSEEFLVEESFH